METFHLRHLTARLGAAAVAATLSITSASAADPGIPSNLPTVPVVADDPLDDVEDAESAESKPVAADVRKLDLGECLAIAIANQPTLRAAHHSLHASRLGYQSLCNIHKFTTILSPDIPIRRQQARLGVSVAEAEVQKVIHEINYDVTRLYWTYVYAKQQEQTANDVISLLEGVVENSREILKAGVPDPRRKFNQFTIYGLEETVDEVRKKRITAVTGQSLALAAMKEAMGVSQDFAFAPKDTELPVMGGEIDQTAVTELAVTRRPEVAQAAAGLEAFRLEPIAQYERRLTLQVPTLASGSDIHSRPLPQPVRNGEYRPGAITPEMPTQLVGRRDDRTARASALSARQEALYEKSVALVRLEAVNTYLQYEAASQQLKVTQSRYENAKTMVDQARLAAVASQDPELVFRSEALAGKAQAEYLEAVFEHIKVLASLERVTAGAVRPEFPGR